MTARAIIYEQTKNLSAAIFWFKLNCFDRFLQSHRMRFKMKHSICCCLAFVRGWFIQMGSVSNRVNASARVTFIVRLGLKQLYPKHMRI